MKKSLELIKPTTRGECVNIVRPCPFTSCRYHLLIDVPTVEYAPVKVRYGGAIDPDTGLPDADMVDMEACEHTCALDAAEDGPHSMDEIAALMGITRQRAEYIERGAFEKLKRNKEAIRLIGEYAAKKKEEDSDLVLRGGDGAGEPDKDAQRSWVPRDIHSANVEVLIMSSARGRGVKRSNIC